MASILIIDDVSFVRKAVRKILKENGHSIFEAANGLEALHIAKKEHIDLMIMDIVMPQMGGAETIMDLYNSRTKPKIIAMTGKVSPDSEPFQKLLNHFGVKDILYKPFNKEILLKTVNKLLAEK